MADYPTSLPSFAANGANLSTAPHSALHTDLNNELLAVATELGLSPSDTFSTVKARLDSIAGSVARTFPLTGVWVSFAPTWSGTLGNGQLEGAYARYGRTVNFRIGLLWGSTTSHAAATQTWSVPFAATTDTTASVITHGATAVAFVGGASWNGIGRAGSATTTAIMRPGQSDDWTNGLPTTWGNGAWALISGTYECTTDV